MNPKLETIIKGHILNPLWKSRTERRKKRGLVCGDVADRYLSQRYSVYAAGIKREPATDVPQEKERLFSIWFQGENSAPPVVKACWRSVRENCEKELVILDASTVFEWISLPEFIVDKWKEGKLRPAHFADICRLALVKEHGGLWLDATDFIPCGIPSDLWDLDFFVYMSGEKQKGWYSYIQNCFIRAKKGNFLVSAWLELILEYWMHEDRPVDYFVHQLLFKLLVNANTAAAEEFAEMPRISQDGAHAIWFEHGEEPFNPESWDKMAAGSIFQKTDYKSSMAIRPIPGTNAHHLISSFRHEPKRLFLFAAFFSEGLVGENLIHYVGNLARCGDVILFADSDNAYTSIRRLTSLTLHTEYVNHGEYDFGSYKRCWQWAKENLKIRDYDFIYLVNDSVFGPLKDIRTCLEQMEDLPGDAFALVMNPSSGHPHLQSWFIGLKKTVFLTEWFDTFLASVKAESDKNAVCIKYETGLTDLLISHGVKFSALFRAPHKSIYNSPLKFYRKGLPFIKKSSFIRHEGCLARQIKKILENTPQDISRGIIDEVENLWGAEYTKKLLHCGIFSPTLRYAKYLTKKGFSKSHS